MVRRKCKNPKFDVIICCQGQPFHYYHSTLIGALIEYWYQYLKKGKYETMNFTLKQVLFIDRRADRYMQGLHADVISVDEFVIPKESEQI